MKKHRRNEILLDGVGKKLTELRKERGLSQQIVYIHTGIHINMVENGKHNITLSTLTELCDYYNVSLYEFFKEIQNP